MKQLYIKHIEDQLKEYDVRSTMEMPVVRNFMGKSMTDKEVEDAVTEKINTFSFYYSGPYFDEVKYSFDLLSKEGFTNICMLHCEHGMTPNMPNTYTVSASFDIRKFNIKKEFIKSLHGIHKYNL